MRVKANFSVFGRKLPSGKKVYYYHCYDAKGKRQWAKSTGKTKKTEAVLHCMDLFRAGLLIPEQKVPTFAEFSEGWWDIETYSYLKRRQLQEPAAETTIHSHRGNFKNHIKDYFAKYKLDEITPDVIEGWLLHMSEKTGLKENKKAAGKKLNAKTVNLAYVTLKLMMNEAARKKLIKSNPCKEVKKLKEVAERG
ncbi:MAG: N-terminal phage integrase SAM-like domain-containing protein [Treponema sp.]|nr:N-terminal phage integrase SAM-like domain-containing protein [Treponema sp.]